MYQSFIYVCVLECVIKVVPKTFVLLLDVLSNMFYITHMLKITYCYLTVCVCHDVRKLIIADVQLKFLIMFSCTCFS